MKRSTKHLAKGRFRIVKGLLKGVIARVTASRRMAVKGGLDRIAGKMQCRLGKAQGLIGL